MLEQIRIENYKSIKQLAVDVGRFNVFIGENGAGKSNFLEALAVYGAVEANKFDHEFLASRGIRMVDADLMFSRFDDEAEKVLLLMKAVESNFSAEVILVKNQLDYTKLQSSLRMISDQYGVLKIDEILNILDVVEKAKTLRDEVRELIASIEDFSANKKNENFKLNEKLSEAKSKIEQSDYFHKVVDLGLSRITGEKGGFLGLDKFILYTPENSALRNLEKEGQILPLGVNGEGLYRLLQVMQQDEPDAFKDVMECLEVFDWIELDDNDQCAVSINDAKSQLIQKIRIKDRYLISELDQRSANEGFLFVLFYAALFCSKHTPKIFAIDNIDASLNPRLCQKLTEKLVKFAKKYDKQVFVTTHNPAILDGLDLHDPEQALFVVNRNRQGYTQLKRLTVENLPKALTENQDVNRLSEAFIRGYLGGLPSNF